MNGTHNAGDAGHNHPSGELHFSDSEGSDSPDDGVGVGDYSTRLEELMSDGEDGEGHRNGAEEDDEDDEEGGFLYSGVDADPTGGYREQLRDVLGPEHEEDELEDEQEVERSLVHEVEENEKFAATIEDEAGHVQVLPPHETYSLSPKTPLPTTPASRMSSYTGNGTSLRTPLTRPYLHPSISRLRSVTPQPSRVPSAASAATLHSHLHESVSAAPSHFSALSRSSSVTNLSAHVAHGEATSARSQPDREVLRWTQLRLIGEHIYAGTSKASSLLGAQSSGSPTVLAANGLICIGTDTGRVLVFDFKQNLKCVCGNEASEKSMGGVTALALSFDHTYVAVGHATGHIQLYDLRSPKAPARVVPPTTLSAVASGRQEGHLPGSRIVSIGFVAGRHTALVSADDSGLAFYHSLGKIFFVDATDILRILGKYPDEDGLDGPPALGHRFRRKRTRKPTTILSMSPLPLGTCSHPTDSYNLIALLTPIKLVIVGLKPSPKTWYRRHRDADEEVASKSRFKGTLAWFPSVSLAADLTSASERDSKKSQVNGTHPTSIPTLAYSWGNTLNLLRVSEDKVTQLVKDPKTGKANKVEVGRIIFDEVGSWTASDDILALQWLNVNQIIVLTPAAFEIYDIRTFKLVEREPFDAWTLVSPVLSHTTNGSVTYSDAVSEVAHSVRMYKGKLFLLGQHGVQVGTLLTWADRILSYVSEGDFLSAIDLARSYYVGEAPGNRNGLPDDPEKLKAVVGQKLCELMVASAQYAFSEDRLTDNTHVTSDGRGVDRTDLFEGLVSTCARASIALGDFDFFFEDLFGYYDNNGIVAIFLRQLEPFMLDGEIRHVPPRITQRLVALHDEDNRPDLVERLIWHMDPDCLDINQAITLCQRYHLYDALIYVYTRALRDYVSPVVELLGLVRQVQRWRRQRVEASPTSSSFMDEQSIEPVILNAYKIYPYIADTLTGLTYPSEEPLPDDEAFEAKNAVYNFLFDGRSSVWPVEGGKLVLTSDEDNGVEPTYPYIRLLLRFDPEAFLHTLDLAFEDTYLNDDSRGVSRFVIIKILLEVLASPDLSQEERTFVHIFVARNVPKYPQFIQMQPSILHSILIRLAEDPDESTREDRQLAAEFLLSAYTPHESERILELFKQAGFYRILRSWYKQEKKWPQLLGTFLEDRDLPQHEIFTSIHDTLVAAKRANKGKLPQAVSDKLLDALPDLLLSDIPDTAALVDAHIPDFHEAALYALGPDAEHDRFLYLQYLLQPHLRKHEEDESALPRKPVASPHVSPPLRQAFISLHCRTEPSGVISALQHLPDDYLDRHDAAKTCEENEVFDAVIWLIDRAGDPQAALAKAQSFDQLLSTRIADALTSRDDTSADSISGAIQKLDAVADTATSVCVERSQSASASDVPLEDLWFQLLSSQIDCVQRVASCCSLEALRLSETVPSEDPHVQREHETISALRSLVHKTFTSLMSVSSTRAVSFPRLFKRLVGSASASKGHVSKGTLYTEFRTILTGMLESFRSEGDMLVITKHLVDRDVFDTIEELVSERAKGWAPARGACVGCGAAFVNSKKPAEGEAEPAREPVVVSRTGDIYHSRCLPPDFHANHTANVH
ncbi:Golgi CORVET complex core vacuolar protein 8-domain-containing protein [Trametes elegans]|nr:Golgi CORVET complex core vacuolar protein 8-domain-containing protein [Trametes elegans]